MAGAPVRLHALGASLEFETAAPGGDACAAPLAGQVWDAALCVFAFLAREPPGFTRRELAGVAAVELGAGTGVAGVALALLGCRVLLTDQEAALPLLARNVAAASRASPTPLAAAAAALPWGDAGAARAALSSAPQLRLQAPLPLLLGSDVVYAGADVAPLLATLRALAGPGTRALLAVDAARSPDTLAAFTAGAVADGWRLRRVPDAQLDPVVRHPDIQLLLLRMGGNAAADEDDGEAEAGSIEAGSTGASHTAAAGGADAARADAAAWEARRLGTAAARLLAGIGVPQPQR